MLEIGSTLREARLSRHIDVVKAEHDTKIRSKYIQALESEQFDVLPGPVYTRGFLRTYARYLGLDGQLYIDEYNSRFGRFAELEEVIGVMKRERTQTGPRRIITLGRVAIASLIALALLLWLGLSDAQQKRSETGRVVPDASRSTSESGKSSGTGTGAVNANSRGAGSRVEKVAGPPAPPQRVSLEVVLRGGSSWVEVRRGSNEGEVLHAGVIADGKSMKFTGAKRLFVRAGAPSVVVLRQRGKTSNIKSSAVQEWMVTASQIKAL